MRRLLMFLVLSLGLCVPSMATNVLDVPGQEDKVMTIDGIQLAYAGDAIVADVRDIDPPVVGVGDLVTNLPATGSGTGDWLFWVFGIVAVVLYEIVFRFFPTTKDWSVLSLIYRVCNFLAPNRVKGGGTFKVKKVK